MHITDSIIYVGVNDHDIDLFESQYPVPNGMAYNSYVIMDDKIAVIDSVEARFGEEWLHKLQDTLNGRQPDYLIVQHMEPDHSANITSFMAAYPAATVVASAAAFNMMRSFFGNDYADRRRIVKEGDVLPLGSHTLTFIAAPMVHWPEVMLTYDQKDKVLFSADAFGKFGALDVQQDWTDEGRRYYFGVVSKFGMQVQQALKKISAFDVQTICALHGPVLKENLAKYLALYDIWSAYRPEESGITIAYSSVYGHTQEAVERLAAMLREKGQTVAMFDLSRCDVSEAMASAFRYDRLVLATTTYNTGVFPSMHNFLHLLTDHNFQNRTVALIENGSWAPMAAKGMRALLENSKSLTFTDTTVRILSSLNEDSLSQLHALADELSR